MEITCSRCHQTLQEGDCYCPVCGLPQLVYAAETSATAGQTERWGEAVRDASTIDWKPAMRTAIALAGPAGLLCAILSRIGPLGLFMMLAAAAWVVALYMRSQRPAWITIGAGARIGLVTGIFVSCLASAFGTGALFIQRYAFHQGQRIDTDWRTFVDLDMQVSQQFASIFGSVDPASAQAQRVQMQAWMLSPDGHAGFVVASLAWTAVLLILSAVAGGALGARFLGRPRRSEN